MSALSSDPADPDLIHQHEHVVAHLKERHQRTIERLNQSLSDILPHNIEGIITQLESCGACQNCMEVCPVCAVDFPRRNADSHYQPADIKRWLISCAGCGMCEQACANHLPLNTIFKHIRDQLAQEFCYTPGRFTGEPLPIH
jgi:Pyruvate/2-oxoacid:ferredoxin oxidoreductase delta subunit